MIDDPKLAQPTPSARAETQKLCNDIVEAVRADEQMLPIKTYKVGSQKVCCADDVEDLVARLALEVTLLKAERDRLQVLVNTVIDADITALPLEVREARVSYQFPDDDGELEGLGR